MRGARKVTGMNDSWNQGFSLPPEQQAIRDRCFHPEGGYKEFRKHEIEQSIPERFEEMVRRYPGRLAIKMDDRRLTYDELNQAANRVAHRILEVRRTGGEPVALLLEHGVNIITGILAVLKTGSPYVALDPYFPPDRLRYILQDSRANLVLVDGQNSRFANLLELDSARLLDFDALEDSWSTANLGLAMSPDAISHLIYTSGSTGKPKGVIQNHINILQETMVYTNGFHISERDRMTLLASCASGQGAKNAFAALLSGASLFPLEVKSRGLKQVIRHLIEENITSYHSSVTLFRQWVGALTGAERFPDLRLIRLASQQVIKKDVESYKRHFADHCILVNALSSSETGTFRWFFINKETSIDHDEVPVGYPLDDKTALLINDDGEETKRGDIGEIAIRSRYLSPGYWCQLELTESKFSPNPASQERTYHTGDLGRLFADGCLIHVGRKGLRVKIRGYSIEIAEIEKALMEHDKVKDTGVVAWDDGQEEKYLVSYLVPHPNSALNVDELRAFLKLKLPDYMIPVAFIFMDSLPLTNGKLDRQALPKPEGKRPQLQVPYVDPRSETEQRLVEIWEQVLQRRPVGINDNFFDLGGHSLAASRVLSRAMQLFQVELPIKAFSESSTVAEMAALIERCEATRASEETLHRMLSEVEAMTDEEAQRQLAGEIERSQSGDGHE
jgi:amino acid adenylation domain-containing protein